MELKLLLALTLLGVSLVLVFPEYIPEPMATLDSYGCTWSSDGGSMSLIPKTLRGVYHGSM